MRHQSLDTYDCIPEDMLKYLRTYGWNFNRKMFEFAVSLMRAKDGSRITPMSKEKFNELLTTKGVSLDNDNLYNGMYVYHMAKADFYRSSIIDELHLALYVKDVIDDVDAPEGCVFNSFYAKMIKAGVNIDWEEML